MSYKVDLSLEITAFLSMEGIIDAFSTDTSSEDSAIFMETSINFNDSTKADVPNYSFGENTTDSMEIEILEQESTNNHDKILTIESCKTTADFRNYVKQNEYQYIAWCVRTNNIEDITKYGLNINPKVFISEADTVKSPVDANETELKVTLPTKSSNKLFQNNLPISKNNEIKQYFVIAEQGTRPTKYHVTSKCEYKGYNIFSEHTLAVGDMVSFEVDSTIRYGSIYHIKTTLEFALAAKKRCEEMPAPFKINRFPRYKTSPSNRGIISHVYSNHKIPKKKNNPISNVMSTTHTTNVDNLGNKPKTSLPKIPKLPNNPLNNFQINWQHPSASNNPKDWKLFKDIVTLFAPTSEGPIKADRNVSPAYIRNIVQNIEETFFSHAIQESKHILESIDNINNQPSLTIISEVFNDGCDKKLRIRNLSASSSSSSSSSSSCGSSSSSSSSTESGECSSSSSSNSSSSSSSSADSYPMKSNSRSKNVPLHFPLRHWTNQNQFKLKKYDPTAKYLKIDRLMITKSDLNSLIGAKKIKTRQLIMNIIRIHPALQSSDWASDHIMQSNRLKTVRSSIIDWLLHDQFILTHKYIQHDTKETLMESVRNICKTAKKTLQSRNKGDKNNRTSATYNRLTKWSSYFSYL